MQITVHYERAALVFGNLLGALVREEFPYDTTAAALPQNHIPCEITDDPLIHARFLFYVCHYMRGTIQSDMAIRALVRLYHERPEFFVPAEVLQMHEADIAFELYHCINYLVREIPGFWLENSKRLHAHWDSDPRKIFESADAETVRTRMINRGGEGFLGFQAKMASMLAYFLIDASLIEPFIIAPAVDFHITRVLFENKIIEVEPKIGETIRYDRRVIGPAIDLLEKYCQENEVNPKLLGDALWLLSKMLCSRAPGNRTHGGEPIALDWRKKELLENHIRSCGSCPAWETCAFNVPARPYYAQGQFKLRPREKPPLLFEHLPHQRRPQKPIV